MLFPMQDTVLHKIFCEFLLYSGLFLKVESIHKNLVKKVLYAQMFFFCQNTWNT